MLVGTPDELWFYSNGEDRAQRCEDGVHGLGNHLLDTPWPKVARGRQALAALLREASRSREHADDGEREERRQDLVRCLLDLLGDTALAADDLLPSTGRSLERERALSAIRIVTPG